MKVTPQQFAALGTAIAVLDGRSDPSSRVRAEIAATLRALTRGLADAQRRSETKECPMVTMPLRMANGETIALDLGRIDPSSPIGRDVYRGLLDEMRQAIREELNPYKDDGK